MSTLDSCQTKLYELNPEEIAQEINKNFNIAEPKKIKILDFEFIVLPHVYPSNKFRSTYTTLEAILDKTEGKKVCEIGCGCGTLGQISLLKGAKKLVQGDINQFAITNANLNKANHNFSDEKLAIFESDCFDNIPKEKFDVIVFAMPYHDDNVEIRDPLMHAFYDPNFKSIKKFLAQVFEYTYLNTEIFISFSSKGNVERLEKIFDQSNFNWELCLVKHQNSSYDNRVYKLTLR